MNSRVAIISTKNPKEELLHHCTFKLPNIE